MYNPSVDIFYVKFPTTSSRCKRKMYLPPVEGNLNIFGLDFFFLGSLTIYIFKIILLLIIKICVTRYL